MEILYRLKIFLLLLSVYLPLFAGAQVTLLPTSVFLTGHLGIGSVDVSNDTDMRQEVSVRFEFAWLGSDEGGHLMMISDDEDVAARYGIDDEIRAFPRTFLLPSGGRQTVRFQVRPLHDRPDGVYWTRAIITSRKAAEDVGRESVSEELGTQIHYVFKQNIPVFYRKGHVRTGLEIRDVVTEIKKDKLVVKAALQPTGNAPFNGSMDLLLRNSSGQVVGRRHTTAVIYFESLRRFELPFHDVVLDQGDYSLELIFQTRRRDMASADLVQAPPVKHRVFIRIE